MDFQLPGYVVTINEDGLSKLSFGGVVIGQGANILIDGQSYYNQLYETFGRIPNVLSKTVVYTADGAVVTHTYGGLLTPNGLVTATVVYTYTVSGNDVHISAVVFNSGAKPLQPGFKSMHFLRGTGGSYVQFAFDQNHTRSRGENLSYPCSEAPYAASAFLGVPSTAGPQLNLATWSEEDPNEKFMSFLNGIYQVPGTSVENVFFNRVPPGGSRVYKWAFRFVNSSDWKDLLASYKTALRSVFPTVAYEPDARPLAQFTAINTAYIRPDNPYGYGDSGDSNCSGGGLCRRLDKPVGVQNYISLLVGPMLDTNYQGIVMWQPQGINPRGVQYRPDFHVFNPDTLANLPTLTSGFRNAGLSIGLLSRTGVIITSATWTTDATARQTDHEDALGELKGRIQWALSNNFNAFYLDSFVIGNPDHNVLKFFRSIVGPNVHTFCEFSTALSMAYSANYMQIHWDNGGILWDQRAQILRWLWPESIIAVKFADALPPGGLSALYTAMFDLKLTPWVEDHKAAWVGPGSDNSILKPLVASRIGANKRWM